MLGEFGEVLGIVTMKDVLAFIFGELTTSVRGSEEYERTDHGHIAPGWMRLLDFYTLTNIDIDDPVMTTLGGLVLRLVGRLPQVGEAVDYEGYHFHVLGIDGLRISRVEVSKVAVPAAEAASELDMPDSLALLGFQGSEDRADADGEANDGLTAEERAKRKRKHKRKQRAKAKAAAAGST